MPPSSLGGLGFCDLHIVQLNYVVGQVHNYFTNSQFVESSVTITSSASAPSPIANLLLFILTAETRTMGISNQRHLASSQHTVRTG